MPATKEKVIFTQSAARFYSKKFEQNLNKFTKHGAVKYETVEPWLHLNKIIKKPSFLLNLKCGGCNSPT